MRPLDQMLLQISHSQQIYAHPALSVHGRRWYNGGSSDGSLSFGDFSLKCSPLVFIDIDGGSAVGGAVTRSRQPTGRMVTGGEVEVEVVSK